MGALRRTGPLVAAVLLCADLVAAPPVAALPVVAGARPAPQSGCTGRSDLLGHAPVARWAAPAGVSVTAWNGTDGSGHPVRLTVATGPTARVRLAASATSDYGDARPTTLLVADTPRSVVGVNGDYFAYDWTGDAVPYGPLVRGGRVLRMPPGSSPVIGADDTGRPVTGRARVDGTVRLPTAVLPVASVNDDGGSGGADPVAAGRALAVVTPYLAGRRPPRAWEVVVRRGVVVAAGRRLSFGSHGAFGSGSAGRADVLLAASGAAARTLRGARVTTAVRVAYAARTDGGTRLREAVGSGSVMLRAGRSLATCDGSGGISRPRTLVAWDARRSRVWFLTVDGRGPDAPVSRYGLGYAQITQVARALGATEAVMLDGGGSTTMALREGGSVRRVDAREDAPQRPVPDGLVLAAR